MKSIGKISTGVLLVLLLSACNNAPEEVESNVLQDHTQTINLHSPESEFTDWKVALQYLKEGNERYISNSTIIRDTNEADREILKDEQHPFAVIVTCSDSRVAPEIYFDQKLGDIFVIRNAGNISDESVLGSIEYAVDHLRIPLVVVVGHTNCGAVGGAFSGGEYPSNLLFIIDVINTATEGCTNLDEAISANTKNTIKQIKNDEVIEELGTVVIGACYDIKSGVVTWIN